jgi:hypothetical protein
LTLGPLADRAEARRATPADDPTERRLTPAQALPQAT